MSVFPENLSAADLRPLGIPDPWSFGIADRVRFHEIDALGHVNNVAYLRWFETVRVRWITHVGLYDTGMQSVLRSQACDYAAPMFLDARYVVTTCCAHVGTTSFRAEYAVWSEGRQTASGFAVIVAVNADGRKAPVPETVRARLEAAGA